MTDLKTFVVYNSSAGSGKTFTLAKEYIKLAIPNPNKVKGILAITFTNKAANEMKERILLNLKELSEYPEHTENNTIRFLLPALEEETGISSNEIAVKAEKVLKYILHNYSEFGICTIDSFMHRIIRTFAHDLQIPQNFEIELNSSKILEEGIGSLIDLAGENPDLTSALTEFTLHNTDNSKSYNLERELEAAAKTLFDEDSQVALEALKGMTLSDFNNIRSSIIAWIAAYKKEITNIGQQAVDLINSQSIAPEAFASGEKAGIAKYFIYLSSFAENNLSPTDTHTKIANQDKWHSAKASASDIAKIEEIKPRLLELFNEAQVLNDVKLKQFQTYKKMIRTLYPVSLLNELSQIIGTLKSENNIKLLSEFNKHISGIVMEQPTPFIYERIGEKYQHYLIDEFQDTSVQQWHNLIPLIDNSLASGNFNMIVGDGKQAIYRFRSGEVEQFACLPKIYRCPENHYRDFEKNLERYYLGEVLKQNFRSKAEIVEFNNDFFRFVAPRLSPHLQKIYETLEQEFNSKNTGGLVDFYFSKPELELVEEIFLDHQEEVFNIIDKCTKDHYKYNDIAILCRSNKHASALASQLITRGIPVVSSESLLIDTSPKVKLIVALIQLLENPDNQIAKTLALMVTHKIFSNNPDENPHHFLEQNKPTDIFSTLENFGINLSANTLRTFSIYEICEALSLGLGFSNESDLYIEFFLDFVFQFTRQNLRNSSISEFLEWWDKEKVKLSVVIPDQTNAVKILTIHKSKGLQFPVVILPFAIDKLRIDNQKWLQTPEEISGKLPYALVNIQSSKSDVEHWDPDFEEESEKTELDLINILYVALTRPENRLYILSSMPKPTESKKTKKEEEEKPDLKIKSLAKLFTAYLKHKEILDKDTYRYQFGAEIPKSGVANTEDVIENNNRNIASDWRKKIRLSTSASKAWSTPEKESITSYGNMIHYIMSMITQSNNIDKAIEKVVLEGICPVSKSDEIKTIVRNILCHPDLQNIFSPQARILNEADILCKDGSVLRPDRIALIGKTAYIADFKTGTAQDKHRTQIENYGDLLTEMGFEVVEKWLVYIGEEIKAVLV